MSLLRLMVLVSVTSLAAFGASIYVFNGPDNGGGNISQLPGPFQGFPCNPSSGNCVIGNNPGSLSPYTIFQVTLQQISTATNRSDWEVKITTNYPSDAPLYPGLAGASNLLNPATGPKGVPPVPFNSTNPGTTNDVFGNPANFSMGDLLFSWNNTFYALVMSAHDGFVVGDLYQANKNDSNSPVSDPGVSPDTNHNAFMRADQILPSAPRPDVPMWLAPLTGVYAPTIAGISSVMSVVTNVGQAETTGLYTITDRFSVINSLASNTTNNSADFLGADKGKFLIEISSFVCANGVLVGDSSQVPEPRTLFLIIPAVLLLGRRFARSRGAQA